MKRIEESQITSSSAAAVAALPPSLVRQVDREQAFQQDDDDDDKTLQKQKSPKHVQKLLSFSSSSSSSLPVMTSDSNDVTERRDCDDDGGGFENDAVELSSLSNMNDENQDIQPSASITPTQDEQNVQQNDDEFVPIQRSPTFGKILRSGTLIGLIYSIITIIPLSIAMRIDKKNECTRQAPPVKDWVNVQLILHYAYMAINLITLLIITRTDFEST